MGGIGSSLSEAKLPVSDSAPLSSMNWLKGLAAASIGAPAIGINSSKDDRHIFIMERSLDGLRRRGRFPVGAGRVDGAAATGCGRAVDEDAAGILGLSRYSGVPAGNPARAKHGGRTPQPRSGAASVGASRICHSAVSGMACS